MVQARSIPAVFKPSCSVKFAVPFEFYLDQDLCVTCIDECGNEKSLELGHDYTVEGGGSGKACKANSGSICLACPMPECTIVIEHFPKGISLDPSVKALTRKEAAQGFTRMQSQIDALVYRLSLAPSLPITHDGIAQSLLRPSVPDGEACDDGFWCDTNPIEDDCAWPEDGQLIPQFCEDGVWDEKSKHSQPCEWGEDNPYEDDGVIIDFEEPPAYRPPCIPVIDDGDVSVFYSDRSLKIEVAA